MKEKTDIMLQDGDSREIIIYRDGDNAPKVEVLLQHQNLWLSQKALSTLFDVNVPAISKHIKNIFESGELDEKVVVSILEITTQHGAIAGKTQNKETKFYNLELVIAVGYSGQSISI